MTGHDGELHRSVTHLALHVGTDWHTMCHTYPHRSPILSVDAGPSLFSLSVAGGTVTADHLRFARTLQQAVSTYLAECEPIASAVQNDNFPAENAA
ncbi:hypothetical protein ACG83_14565 [Frankia sp. R43]|uniref:hypothetical protein n=1 Tax=Frankia sp. R43 TaxID=269536 RepID=UPI0006C9F382|nr:hypothetical protein [Frankia sp. R43]KPM54690.1 hypothetical protein ACG83_14565 [Frankia sp. R43]